MLDYYLVEIEYCIDETVEEDFNFLFDLVSNHCQSLGLGEIKRLYEMDEALVQDVTAYMKSINVFTEIEDEDFDYFMEFMDDELTSEDPANIHRWSTESCATNDDEIVTLLKQLQELKGQYWKINQVLVYDRGDEDAVKFKLTNDGKIKRLTPVIMEPVIMEEEVL